MLDISHAQNVLADFFQRRPVNESNFSNLVSLGEVRAKSHERTLWALLVLANSEPKMVA